MPRKPSGPRIATANRLHDGLVVFLDEDGDWTRDLRAARVAQSDTEAAELETEAGAAVDSNIVVAPYLIEVEAQNGSGFVPVQRRERIRIAGPTVGHSLKARANGTAGRPSGQGRVRAQDSGIHVQI